MDIFFASIFIIALLPLFVVIPLLIKSLMGGSVLFSQVRIGLNKKPFKIYKFRSMKAVDKKSITDSQRITSLGRILRVTRIDEFPQLINVLKGDMSFIGPRPLLPEYLPFYTAYEIRRHDVKPGLSGLSPVSASYPPWEEQFKFDIYYVENISFKLDMEILLKTITKILSPSKKLVSGVAGRPKFDVYRQNQSGI